MSSESFGQIKFTPLSQLGEFRLIDKFKGIASRFSSPTVVQGIGDDATVLRSSPGKLTLVTTDTLMQAVHFDLSYTSMKHLGHKAAAANLSDIAAMSGLPVAALVSLGIHPNISAEMVEEFYESLTDQLGKLNCVIAGGNTCASPIGFIINVTLIGEIESDRMTLRGGAKAGDVVCMTGDIGRSEAGLKILRREQERYFKAGQPADFSPNFDGYDDALQKHLLPEARVTLSRMLTEKIRVHSMIDISDGLISDLMHICKESNLAAEIEEELIPIDPITRRIANELGDNPLDYALFGGEDYELLFTIGENDFSKLYSLEGNIRAIGRMNPLDQAGTGEQPRVSVRLFDGKMKDYKDFLSYQHFIKRNQ
jgi:thiamine-monophosphate kinase